MGRSSSKPKKPQQSRVTEQDKAVLQLKQQRDKLKQYQKKINVQIEKDRQVAKQLLHDGKKSKAKLMLRKKRFQESLLEKTDGQLENIERMVHDLEFAQIEAKVLEGLQAGNESLKKLHQLMSIEDVERIMDETKDSIAYQQEIDEILAGGLSEQDEDDVLAELEAITQEAVPADQEIPLPEVPTDELPEVQKEKEKKKAQKEERQAEAMLAS